MGVFTEKAIEGIRQHIFSKIKSARYTINGKEYQGDIQDMYFTNDKKLHVNIMLLNPGSGSVTITKVSLYDDDNQLYASKAENTVVDNYQQGVFYRFIFDVKEG